MSLKMGERLDKSGYPDAEDVRKARQRKGQEEYERRLEDFLKRPAAKKPKPGRVVIEGKWCGADEG